METNLRASRDGGRPRSFENEDVFRGTAAVLARLGHGGLSLEAVAQEVGVSGPAISKRFGSKPALLRAYLSWTIQTARERFWTSRARHASPLAALWARYLMPFEDRPEELGAFSGWLDMRKDPDLAPLLQERRHVWETEAASLLADAQEAGELIACDVNALACAVTAALAGSTLHWSGDDESLLTRYATILDTIVGPYRASGVERANPVARG
jgi:AcrR family transcriptional regulator